MPGLQAAGSTKSTKYGKMSRQTAAIIYAWKVQFMMAFESHCKVGHHRCLCFNMLTAGQTGDGEVVNMEMKLSIASLSLVLNKQQYELARAQVSNVASDIVARDGNLAVTGQLGSMLLQDTSPHGALYRERFVTTGSQALVFDFFKYITLCVIGAVNGLNFSLNSQLFQN